MRAKPHVWRYNATMPPEELPWIVSEPGFEAREFPTHAEACAYLRRELAERAAGEPYDAPPGPPPSSSSSCRSH